MSLSQRILTLFTVISLWGFHAQGDLYCKYSCDANKARKTALTFLETGTLPCGECFDRCAVFDLTPFFCELFSIVLDKAYPKNPEILDRLIDHLIAIPHQKRKPLSGKNNYAYRVLRHISPQVCAKRLNLVNSAVPAQRHEALMKAFGPFLDRMRSRLEARYPTFEKVQREKHKRTQKLDKPEAGHHKPKKKHMMMRLFNWCYNYCNGQRAAKTSETLEDLVRCNPGSNPGEIIDLLKAPPRPFAKSPHVAAKRAYKCLTQCSLKNVESYLCHLVENIDLMDRSKGDVPKKTLDVIGQILLMSSQKGVGCFAKKSKLSRYLNNPHFKARCMKLFEDLYYSGENYQINMDYLKRSYVG